MSDFDTSDLREDHRLAGFDCGKEPLTTWLHTQAQRAQKAGTARTVVWTRPGQADVVAYYSVAPTQVARAELPTKSLAGGFSVVPSYLLARLALDHTLHGQGLGGELLWDALERIVAGARQLGGRLIVVDALDDDAHAFYVRHNFIPVTDSHRLYLKIATVEQVLKTW